MVMRCVRCGSILKKDQIGVITYYLIKQDSIVLEKKEALCPVCGWCLGYKLFNKIFKLGD